MKMPAIFIGHGWPMNALEDNICTKEWRRIGNSYSPKGIVVISAHWYTRGLFTQDDINPKKINDMYGFPKELYEFEYPAKGSEKLTKEITRLLGDEIRIDNSWGLDHGAWTVLAHLYPNANIPIVQVSVDANGSSEKQFEVGRKLSVLRDLGYMIIGSGNIVHGTKLADPRMKEPFTWAKRFDDFIEDAIEERNYSKCIHFQELGIDATNSVPTPEHYYPLLSVLGATDEMDEVEVFNKIFIAGGVSMTGYVFNAK